MKISDFYLQAQFQSELLLYRNEKLFLPCYNEKTDFSCSE